MMKDGLPNWRPAPRNLPRRSKREIAHYVAHYQSGPFCGLPVGQRLVRSDPLETVRNRELTRTGRGNRKESGVP